MKETLKAFQNDLANLTDGRAVDHQLNLEVVRICKDYIRQIKQFLADNPHLPDAEEIHLNKYVVPRILGEQLFRSRLIEYHTSDYEVDEIVNDVKKIRKKLKRTSKFAHIYRKLDQSGLDVLLFQRSRRIEIYTIDIFAIDDTFPIATSYYAHHTSLDLLTEYSQNLKDTAQENQSPINGLKWMGKNAELVELAFGLSKWVQLDGKESDPVKLAIRLSETFGAKISNIHQVVSDLKDRKKESVYFELIKESAYKNLGKKP